MDHRLVFAPEAFEDLRRLSLELVVQAGPSQARAYIERVEAWCAELAETPYRGLARGDLFPGLRILGFERRLAFAFHIGLDTVTIDRIVYGGAPDASW